MDTKGCTKCGETKDVTEFYKRKDRPLGIASVCKNCSNKRYKEYILSNPRSKYKYPPQQEGCKTCKKCDRELHVSKFRVSSNLPDGRGNSCKKCMYDYALYRLRSIPEVRIKNNLRNRVRQALKGKNKSASTLKLLGCTTEYLIQHLESQFTTGMCMENYGEWHIDHILPCVSFNLLEEEQQQKCFHYTNLQPLWAKENLSKGGRIC